MKTTIILFFASLSVVASTLPIVPEEVSDRAIKAFMREDLIEIHQMVEFEGYDPNFSIDGKDTIFDDVVNEIVIKDHLGFKKLNFNKRKAVIFEFLLKKGASPNYLERSRTGTTVLEDAADIHFGNTVYGGDFEYFKWLHEKAGLPLEKVSVSFGGKVTPMWGEVSVHSDPRIMDYLISKKPNFHKKCWVVDFVGGANRVRINTEIFRKRDPNFVHPYVVFFKYVSQRYGIPFRYGDDIEGFRAGLERICGP